MSQLYRNLIFIVLALAAAIIPNYLLINKAMKVASEIQAVGDVVQKILVTDVILNERMEKIEALVHIDTKQVLEDRTKALNNTGKIRDPKKISDYLGN